MKQTHCQIVNDCAFQISKVLGDGNCFYRAIADQTKDDNGENYFIFIRDSLKEILESILDRDSPTKYTRVELIKLLEIVDAKQFIPSDMVPMVSEALGFGICVVQPSLTSESELVLTNGQYDPFSPLPVLAKQDCLIYLYFNGGDETNGG